MKITTLAVLLAPFALVLSPRAFAQSPSDSTATTASGSSEPKRIESAEYKAVTRLYVHPVFTIASAISSHPLILPLTLERTIAPGRSIVIQPTLTVGTEPAEDDNPELEVFQLRGVVGYRMYFNGQEPFRWYFAPSVAAEYIDLDWKGDERYAPGYATANMLGALFYVGYVGQGRLIDVDANIGLGAQTVQGGGKNFKIASENGPLIDANLGISFHL